MKLFWLIALTMTAFAFNSILTRLALEGGETGPASFAMIRLFSGAVTLIILIALRRAAWPRVTRNVVWGAGTLALYALGFSYAYITLPTGVGALILFGGVQVMSFALTLVRGQQIKALSWLGASVAFSGLCYLLWPGLEARIDPWGTTLMLFAALGWTLYTAAGAKNTDPLGLTGLAFICATPIAVVCWLISPDRIALSGLFYGALSGAVTSGLGYALWYRVLPQISLPLAAVAQLTVPVIAALGGAVFLKEALTLTVFVATVLVLSGVGLTIYAQRR